MIAYIEGQIILIEKDFITLKTSDGVGYEVYILKQLSSNLSLKDYLALHIYTNVKEDDISLYGFKEIEEKELFTMLIKTSGVGPKLGLAILSVLSPNQLVDAVHQNNAVSFSEVPGIGKKTALKLCLDLKDKLKNHKLAHLGFVPEAKNESMNSDSENGTQSVFSALKNLGYQEKEIIKVLRESGNSDLPFENRLKKALSLLTPLR
tara:strand:- start:449 stop:1066 length:618 start_codon:yes stop_codon:yes gene_type:complete